MFGSRFQTTLITVFSVIALLLAAVGTYSVISYSVAERTHEIGLRAALGANAANLRWLVLGQGLLLSVVGLGMGPRAHSSSRGRSQHYFMASGRTIY